MFLFFSKLVTFFIAPANWLVVLCIGWALTKSVKNKKKIAITILIFLFVFGNEFLYTKLVNAWQPKPVAIAGKYRAGILLGGIGSFDKEGNGYLNASSDRLIAMCTLYKTGIIEKILVSAGNIDKERPNEAAYISFRMVQLGVDAADIVVESMSRNTFENAAFTRKKIDSLQLLPPYVLVTSAIHMPRALRVFKKAGLQVIPYPCNYEVIDRKFSWGDYLIPKLYVLNDWAGLLKEVVGVAGYTLFGKA